MASVKGFTLRSQTRKDRIYVHVAQARARISLLKLMTRTVHIRGVDARDVDFRYRERVDSPRRKQKEKTDELPPGFEYYPEIPGFDNPPDPKPEDLYPRKNEISPWTVKITGAHVEGPIRVALNEVRINGEGTAGGGVTVKPKQSITIHRGRLQLAPTTMSSRSRTNSTAPSNPPMLTMTVVLRTHPPLHRLEHTAVHLGRGPEVIGVNEQARSMFRHPPPSATRYERYETTMSESFSASTCCPGRVQTIAEFGYVMVGDPPSIPLQLGRRER